MEAIVTIIVLFATVIIAIFWFAPRPLLDSKLPGPQVPASLGPAELETWFDALGVGELLTRFVSPAVADELGDNLITRARAANNIRDVDGAMARRIARAALERFCAKTAPE